MQSAGLEGGASGGRARRLRQQMENGHCVAQHSGGAPTLLPSQQLLPLTFTEASTLLASMARFPAANADISG